MRSILYLHGFHSSPFSDKALSFKKYMEKHHPDIQVIMPQVAVLPADAIAQVEQIVEQEGDALIGAVGSSMGGFLSTYIHNKYGLSIVVINPAVKPFELFEDYLGPQVHPITGQAYELNTSHIEEMKAIYQPKLAKPENVWCLQQEGDEVLDYREAAHHYAAAKLTLEKGGDHSFVGFDKYLPQIVNFLL